MAEPVMEHAFTQHQDLFGHLIMPKLYTPISVCFGIPTGFFTSSVIDTLTRGLDRLFDAFPWLAGQVVWQDGIGLPLIVPLDTSNRLIVRDLSQSTSVPSADNLRTARFPSSMLDGAVLTPLTGAPTSRDRDVSPVFIVQVTFIQSVLFLTFAGEHSAIDGHGMGQVIRLFSKACRGKTFSEDELQQGNRSGKDLILLLDRDGYKPGAELDYLLPKPNFTGLSLGAQPSDCTWAYFHFSSSCLATLKELATPSHDDDDGDDAKTPYITTNDALSALLWQCIARVRCARLASNATSTFARAVNLRPSLSISPTFLHNMSNHTYTTLPLSTLLEAPLSNLACLLRRALDPSSLTYAMRSLATRVSLQSSPRKDDDADQPGEVAYGSNMSFDRDVFCSSWASLDCYDHDFALGLGLPETVRRPRFVPVQGLVILMPRDRTAAIDVAVCLRDEEMQCLRFDGHFGRYAEWIG